MCARVTVRGCTLIIPASIILNAQRSPSPPPKQKKLLSHQLCGTLHISRACPARGLKHGLFRQVGRLSATRCESWLERRAPDADCRSEDDLGSIRGLLGVRLGPVLGRSGPDPGPIWPRLAEHMRVMLRDEAEGVVPARTRQCLTLRRPLRAVFSSWAPRAAAAGGRRRAMHRRRSSALCRIASPSAALLVAGAPAPHRYTGPTGVPACVRIVSGVFACGGPGVGVPYRGGGGTTVGDRTCRLQEQVVAWVVSGVLSLVLPTPSSIPWAPPVFDRCLGNLHIGDIGQSQFDRLCLGAERSISGNKSGPSQRAL